MKEKTSSEADYNSALLKTLNIIESNQNDLGILKLKLKTWWFLFKRVKYIWIVKNQSNLSLSFSLSIESGTNLFNLTLTTLTLGSSKGET